MNPPNKLNISKECREYFESLPEPIEFTNSEESYRRGYCHGFLAARNNPEMTVQECYDWRHGQDCTAPPGSSMAGTKLDGLTKNDEHRFFINKLKENWND